MALLLAGNVSAVRKDPYSSSRIFWDRNSEKTLFSSGNYARIIQLQDGRIMAAAEAGGGISVCYSSNYGQTWTSPEVIIRSANKVPYAVPDLIQLTDGTIIVGFNPRPSEPYSEDRKFGIRAVRSTDNGNTWSNAINSYVMVHFIYKLNLMGGRNALEMGGPGGPGGSGPRGGGFGGPRF